MARIPHLRKILSAPLVVGGANVYSFAGSRNDLKSLH